MICFFRSGTYRSIRYQRLLGRFADMEHRHFSAKDATSHKRSPAEESFYESFLLQRQSNVGNLYASNVYEVQSFDKTLKHIKRQQSVHSAEMDREIKKLQKRMNALKPRTQKVHYLKQKSQSDKGMSPRSSLSASPDSSSPLLLPRIVLKSGSPLVGGMTRSFSELSAKPLSPHYLSKSCNNLDGIKNKCLTSDWLKNNEKCLRLGANKPSPAIFVTNVQPPVTDSESNDIPISNLETRNSVLINASSSRAKVGRIRASRSNGDLTTLDDNLNLLPIGRRPRASSVAAYKEVDGKELQMRYISREDRVKSATRLPRI